MNLMSLQGFSLGVLFAILCPTTIIAQGGRGFEIMGHIDGLQDGDKVILAQFDYNISKRASRYDSCIVTDGGDMHLKGYCRSGSPESFLLLFDAGKVQHRHFDAILRRNVGGMEFDFYIANGEKMIIHGGDINKMRNANIAEEINVDGSPTYFAASCLEPASELFENAISDINHKINVLGDSVGYDKCLIGSLIEDKMMLYAKLGSLLLKSHDYYKVAVPWVITNLEEILNDHPSFEMDIYNSLNDAAKKSEIGGVLRNMSRLAVGQPLPGFSLPTPSGEVVALKDIVAKSKITLVHLWASNSIYRDQYQKDLRFEFKKYHDKGLNIVAVSSDSLADEWKVRVEIEKYPWVNVSDLKGNLKGGIVNDLYREGGHSVPNTTNILLDENGKIIAWDPTGIVLKWYLDKYLGN